MATHQINLPLFPTLLGVYNFGEVHQRQDEQIVSSILDAYEQDSTGVTASQVGGWHSRNIKDFAPPLEELCTLVDRYAVLYMEASGYDLEVTADNCWANLNRRGDYNMMHHHNKAPLAGVYYPAQCIEDGKPVFNYTVTNPITTGAWDDQGGDLVIQSPKYTVDSRFPETQKTPYNITHYHMKPTSGVLLLFPSYLIHGVTPIKNDTTRVSIAFGFRCLS